MKAYDAYLMYRAVKCHFTKKDYDYFVYNGHVRGSVEAFEKRNDRYFFEYIAYNHHKDLLKKFVVFYHLNRDLYIKPFFDWVKELDKCYYWNKFEEFPIDPVRIVQKDLEQFNRADKYYGSSMYFFSHYMNKNILIETFLLIDEKIDVLGELRKEYNPVLTNELFFLKKYLPFSPLKECKDKIKSVKEVIESYDFSRLYN